MKKSRIWVVVKEDAEHGWVVEANCPHPVTGERQIIARDADRTAALKKAEAELGVKLFSADN